MKPSMDPEYVRQYKHEWYAKNKERINSGRRAKYVPKPKRQKPAFSKECFLRHVRQTAGGCWLWTGRIMQTGYGECRAYNGNRRAHRVAYMLWKGPIPRGMLVCHRCDVRHCCNPEHLFIGTYSDNIVDSFVKGRRATKLSEEKVMEILTDNTSTKREMAIKHGVSIRTVFHVLAGNIWAHVQRPSTMEVRA